MINEKTKLLDKLNKEIQKYENGSSDLIDDTRNAEYQEAYLNGLKMALYVLYNG